MAHIKPLPEILQKIAIDELGEVPARIPQDLDTLRTWIDQQPHLKASDDDQFLIQVLRGSKYSIEKAKQKIDMFYAMKTKYSHLFAMTNVDDEKFRKLHRTGFYAILPTPLHGNGARVVVFTFKFSSKDFNIAEIFQYSVSIVEYLLMNDPYACINGIVCLCDFADATAAHLMQITPTIAKQFANFYEKALPVRVKNFFFINLEKHVQQFLSVILPLLPEKFRNRIILCGENLNELGEKLPKKYLPIEYGGENGSVKKWHIENEKIWDDSREYFKQNSNYGTDESLRIGKALNFNDDLGIGGTFRKLDVD
ncbi:alpha-tocopherol transfer protein-like [Haematobia irritans]|uniref:alpha-tocopherol transfer protein-like n=1 Tax=Haematobia irritans TaxID=7368 RepID=UPI003F4F5BE5